MDKSITEILRDAENATIIAEGENGEKYVTFEDYVNLTVADQVENRVNVQFETNPDGTPAATNAQYQAVNLEALFMNRYKVKDGKLYVVTDWWCITERKTGKIPLKQIPCFVLKRDGKKLEYDSTTTISDQEFLEDFTGTLDDKAMVQILPLISRGEEMTKDALPI
jgi:hypothetical protein